MTQTQRTPSRLFAVFALVLAAALAAATGSVRAAPPTYETSARQALLMDFETGEILFQKNADTPMFPASMTKIMTAALVFDEIKAGRLSLDTTMTVSEKAWRMGGSKMFVRVNDEVSVEDLLRGMIVQSGNDASIVLAEGISGTEEAFAERMTARAHEIGMDSTTFLNATGWPDPNHVTTAHDLARLAEYLIRNYPNFYTMYAEQEFTYGKSLDGKPITQANRNPLLYKSMGADGLKTGHTEASGYGLTASAKRDDRRLILVINGLESVRDRSEESERLINWGFQVFDNYELFKAGETVESADVWLGDSKTVPLVLDEGLTITIPRSARRTMDVKIVYQGPVPAPVTAGAEIGRLEISGPDMEPISRPLRAGSDVGQLDFFGRITSAVNYIVFGSGS